MQSVFAAGLNVPGGLAFNTSGNLFVAAAVNGSIYQFTPSGTRTTFASSGFGWPAGVAFNSNGNLFTSDLISGNIYQFTPSGTKSTFITGLVNPQALAFDSANNLYVLGGGTGSAYIDKITPGGTISTFVSGLSVPTPGGLAFQNQPLPVPEPSVMGLLASGMFGIARLRRRKS